ncbi:hypothetical protein GCM10028799_63420 [Kribbella italica]
MAAIAAHLAKGGWEHATEGALATGGARVGALLAEEGEVDGRVVDGEGAAGCFGGSAGYVQA